MYDTRLGRRWNLDPVGHTDFSPYLTFANNPIMFGDPLGLDSITYDYSGKTPTGNDGDVLKVEQQGGTEYYTMQNKGGGSRWYRNEFVAKAEVKEEKSISGLGQDVLQEVLVSPEFYESQEKARTYPYYSHEFLPDYSVNPWLDNLHSPSNTGMDGTALLDLWGTAALGKSLATGAIGAIGRASARAATTDATAIATETSTNAFKSFTASNYRHNLQVLTGESGVGMDAHHIFPQAKRFQQYFNRVGLNIHDPKNLTWWGSGAHRSASEAYNKAWDGFFKQYPNANLQQIQNFGNSLMKNYGF